MIPQGLNEFGTGSTAGSGFGWFGFGVCFCMCFQGLFCLSSHEGLGIWLWKIRCRDLESSLTARSQANAGKELEALAAKSLDSVPWVWRFWAHFLFRVFISSTCVRRCRGLDLRRCGVAEHSHAKTLATPSEKVIFHEFRV